MICRKCKTDKPPLDWERAKAHPMCQKCRKKIGDQRKPFVVVSQYFETDMIASHGPQGSPSIVSRHRTIKEAQAAKQKLKRKGYTYIYRIEVR